MKHAILIFLGLATSALPASPAFANKEEAAYECSRITEWDAADRCQVAVSKATTFDSEAVAECARITSNQWLAHCTSAQLTRPTSR